MTATAALTAQNTHGVQRIHQIPPPFVQQMIDLCIDDVGVDVVKTGITHLCFDTCRRANPYAGMLASAETIEVVADALRRHNVTTSVVDPARVISRARLKSTPMLTD